MPNCTVLQTRIRAIHKSKTQPEAQQTLGLLDEILGRWRIEESSMYHIWPPECQTQLRIAEAIDGMGRWLVGGFGPEAAVQLVCPAGGCVAGVKQHIHPARVNGLTHTVKAEDQ